MDKNSTFAPVCILKKAILKSKIWILGAKIQIGFFFFFGNIFSLLRKVELVIHQNWDFGQKLSMSPSVCYGKSLFKRPLAVGYVLQYVAQHKLASRAFSKMRRSGFCLAFFRSSVGVLQCYQKPRCSNLFHNENCKAHPSQINPNLLIIIEEFQR